MLTDAHFGVMGAGGWGTALAVVINRAGSRATLWTRNDNVLRLVKDRRVNDAYLSDVFIDPDIGISTSLDELSQQCTHIILAVPSQHVRPLCIALSDRLPGSVSVIIASKGIERGSLALMSEVVSSILPENPVMVLSGPNFAREIAMGQPAATCVAGFNRTMTEKVIYAIGGKFFRPYYSDDIIGVQVGGAVKNVIAIACGICTGKGLGENARAALITRGLSEMKRLARVKGGKEETLSGLAGIGDMVLSCSSLASRNMAFGHALGQGKKISDIIQSTGHALTEGVMTAESVYQLSRRMGVGMPICSTVHEILSGQMDVEDGIEQLLARPLIGE